MNDDADPDYQASLKEEAKRRGLIGRSSDDDIAASFPSAFSLAGAKQAGQTLAAAGHALIVRPYQAAKSLLSQDGQYRAGYQYEPASYEEPGPESGVAKGMEAAGGTLGPGGLAARPANSLGTFVGRVHADNLAQAGRPIARKAIDVAEHMESNGFSPEEIRQTVNKMMEQHDPALGGIHKSREGEWLVELDDSGSRYRNVGPRNSTLGKELSHPDLYQASPEMADIAARRISGEGGWHAAGDPSTIAIGQGAQSRRSVVLHEAQHELDYQSGLSHGSSPEREFVRVSNADVGSARGGVEPRDWTSAGTMPGEDDAIAHQLSIDRYERNAGESRARVVQERAPLSAAERRARDPLLDYDVPYDRQIVSGQDGVGASEARVGFWTDAKKADLAKLRDSGKTNKEIAAELGTTETNVKKAVFRYGEDVGVAQRVFRWTPEAKDALAKMRQEGKTNREIAEALGTSEHAISRTVGRHGENLGIDSREPDPVWTQDRRAQLYELYNGKRRIPEIAKIMGLEPRQIHDFMSTNAEAQSMRAQVPALPTGRMPLDVVGRGRRPEALIDASAMGIEKEIRSFEDQLLRHRTPPNQIAAAINAKFGKDAGGVTGNDVKSGNTWWRVGERSDVGSNQVGFDELPARVQRQFFAAGVPVPGVTSEDKRGAEPVLYGGPGADHPPSQMTPGKDGIDRFEIDDSGSKLLWEPVQKLFNQAKAGHPVDPVPLSDVLRHDELFKQYPGAASIKVRFLTPAEISRVNLPEGDRSAGFVAAFDVGSNTMSINPALANPRHLRQTIIHELQHWIGDNDGFEYGDTSAPHDSRPGEIEAIDAERRMHFNRDERAANPSPRVPSLSSEEWKRRTAPDIPPAGMMKLGGPMPEAHAAPDPMAQPVLFAGEGAAKPDDRKALDQAKQMEADKAEPDKIRKATGWAKGGDGKWRFEINDKDSRLTQEALTAHDGAKGGKDSTLTLGEVLDHQALFDYYPEAKDVKVYFGTPKTFPKAFPNGELAVESTKRNAIYVNSSSELLTPDALRSVVLHEVQHWLGDKNKFEYGNPTKTPYYQLPGEIEAEDVEARRNLSWKERRRIPPNDEPKVPWNSAIAGRNPEADFERIAKDAGYTGKTDSPQGMQAAIRAAWEAHPTDQMADLIERIAKRRGLRAPWDDAPKSNPPTKKDRGSGAPPDRELYLGGY